MKVGVVEEIVSSQNLTKKIKIRKEPGIQVYDKQTDLLVGAVPISP